MSFDHPDRVLILFFTGLGLVLVAGANLCLRRQRLVTAALLLGTLIGGFGWWREDGGAALRLTLALFAGILPWLLLTSRRVVLLITRLMQHLARPSVSGLSLGLLGVLTLVASVGLSGGVDREASDLCQIVRSDEVDGPRITCAAGSAFTDVGSRIALKWAAAPRTTAEVERVERLFLGQTAFRDHLLRHSPAHDRANCHGWVFTGGRFWLANESVEQILRENAYRPVTSPQRDDLVVYREEGAICHTAVVCYVTEGMPVLVLGKWGPFGTYLHAVEQSSYGKHFTYYRSSRVGHLLLGLPEESEVQVIPQRGLH